MKVTILTYGSRGDVQPFLALALRLLEAGHTVTLAAPVRFEDLIRGTGIRYIPLAGDPEVLSRRLNDAGHNFLQLVAELTNHAIEIGAEVWRQTEAACQNADIILHSFLHVVGAHTLARAHNKPDVHVQTFPMFTPTGDYPNVTIPRLPLRSLNRLTHRFAARIMCWATSFGFTQVRRRAALPARKLYWPFDDDKTRPRTPVLCAWSPGVLPASSDWPPHIHVTGYFFVPQSSSYRPPANLQSFLDEGAAPVCITFGSMVNRDRERIDDIVRKSLNQSGQRGIILSGWSGLQGSSSTEVLYLESAPHDWLLPRCRMVIHHGGAGTTAAGLRAGIPNIVVPFLGDQSFWGARVHAIGAGPKPILVKRLSVETLTSALAEADGPSLRARAALIGESIRREDGTGEAIRWIEKYSDNFHRWL